MLTWVIRTKRFWWLTGRSTGLSVQNPNHLIRCTPTFEALFDESVNDSAITLPIYNKRSAIGCSALRNMSQSTHFISYSNFNCLKSKLTVISSFVRYLLCLTKIRGWIRIEVLDSILCLKPVLSLGGIAVYLYLSPKISCYHD